MTETLVLYTNPHSRGRMARWMLEEVGAPYRAEIVGYGPAMKAPDFLAINPMGKVPVLVHGAVVVTETPAICAYLADGFPEAQLAPPTGDPARGAYHRWMFFAAGPLEAAVTNKAMGFELPPGRGGMAGYGSFKQVMETLDQALEKPAAGDGWLVGARFTAADLYLGSLIGFGLSFGTIESHATFVRYWERLAARPASVRARAIDDALVVPESA